jgi:hypothetical protein
VITGVKN